MNLVIFGLTVSSSWGNGHATLWRGLIAALADRGWRITFYERDTPYYAGARDLTDLPGGRLVLYADWETVRGQAGRDVTSSEIAMVTSYCPDALAATALVQDRSRGLKVFYDLDTPVTLSALKHGAASYIGPDRLTGFDLALSYTGGAALAALRDLLGAPRAAALYGHVDPRSHQRGAPSRAFSGDLSYLGTYAADRQPALERLLIEPARQRPERTFVIGGAQYPADFPWTPNILFVRHLPPADHPSFYASSGLTLNVTRAAMAEMGWCPSGRLFEAAACGAAIVTDVWDGLDAFFKPGEEVIPAMDTGDVLGALDLDPATVERIGRRARERVMMQHTSAHRAREFEAIVETARTLVPEEV